MLLLSVKPGQRLSVSLGDVLGRVASSLSRAFSALASIGGVCRPAFVASASKIGVAVACSVGYVLGLFQLGRVERLGSSDRFSVRCPILPQVLPVRLGASLATALVMNIGLALPMLDPRHGGAS